MRIFLFTQVPVKNYSNSNPDLTLHNSVLKEFFMYVSRLLLFADLKQRMISHI